MAAPSGIAGQIGFKSETTWGEYPGAVDIFHPGLISENIQNVKARIDSRGIRAGRRVSHTWKVGGQTISGPINLELFDIPTATLLTHMFGSVTSTDLGLGTTYYHTATPASLTGVSFTCQVGRPDIAGTVRPFTWSGGKITGWNLVCNANEIPTLQLDTSFKSETTGTALASASYASGAAPFVFTEASLTVGGSAVATVEQMNLACSMGLAADRHRIGDALVKQQLESGMRDFTGVINAEFESLTQYERFTDGDEAALVMSFVQTETNSLTITCNVRFDGESPALSGIETLKQNLPFKATSATSDAAAVTALLVNEETTAA